MDEDSAARRDWLAVALERVHATLDRHNVWHSLGFGSMLGAVRDGDVISWDHDIDIFVQPNDLLHLLSLHMLDANAGVKFERVRAAGWRLALNPGRVPSFMPGYLLIYVDESLVGEAYAPVLFDDGVLRLFDLATEVAFWPQSSFPHYFVQELSTATMRGTTYPVPRAAEKWLEFTYGAWDVPVRSAFDGGEEAEGFGYNGDVVTPTLAAQVAWCEAQGWDRGAYRGQPQWPRLLNGAGPVGPAARTEGTSRSTWWHTLDELSQNY